MEDACSVTVTGESIEVGGASLLSGSPESNCQSLTFDSVSNWEPV